MLFMGMLTGWYPAERDNLHIIRVRAKPRVSDCNVVSVKPCAGCPVGQKTHFEASGVAVVLLSFMVPPLIQQA